MSKPTCCPRMHTMLTERCPKHPDKFECPDIILDQRKDGTIGVLIDDGGTLSSITLAFCPFCGTKL